MDATGMAQITSSVVPVTYIGHSAYLAPNLGMYNVAKPAVARPSSRVLSGFVVLPVAPTTIQIQKVIEMLIQSESDWSMLACPTLV